MVKTAIRRRAPPGARGLARALALLLIIAASLAAAPKAYALGQKEDPLRQADALIAEQKYDEAIIFLTDFIAKNPDRFDEAQARLRAIMSKRDEYNKKGEQLIALMRDHPDQRELILKKIEDMKSIMREDPQTMAFINSSRLAAAFVYNKAQAEAIFEQGRLLLDQGKYADAARLYVTGFAYYRDIFDEGPYDAITKKTVASLVDSIKAESEDFVKAQGPYIQAVEAFARALEAGDPAASTAAWPAARDAFRERARHRDIVVGAGRALARMDGPVKAIDGRDNDAAFLPFAFRFTNGRTEAEKPEGVSGSMDAQWSALLGRVETALAGGMSARYAAAETAWAAGRWIDAAAGFDAAAALAGPGLEALSLWSLLAPTEISPALTRLGRLVIGPKAALYESARLRAQAALSAARLARLRAAEAADLAAANDYASRLGPEDALAEVLSRLSASRSAIAGTVAGMEAEAAEIDRLGTELGRWKGRGLDEAAEEAILAASTGRVQVARDAATADAIAVYATALGFEYGRLEADLGTRRDAVAKGQALVDGIPLGAGSGAALDAVALAHYPGQSIQSMTGEAAAVADLRTRIDGYLKRISAEPASVVSSSAVQSWTAKARDLAAAAADIETQRQKTLAAAQDRKRTAEQRKTEGNGAFTDAQRLLAAKNYIDAIARLDRSRESYDASLEAEEDPALRAAWASKIDALRADISDKARSYIVSLTAKGRDYYYAGLYADSKNVLSQAQILASTFSGGADPIVESWLERTNRALSVNSGIHVLPTDANYAMVSQNLSLAWLYFQKGKALCTPKNTPEGEDQLRKARDQVNQILDVYPLNQDANVLALRIDQILDPALYRQEFAEKLATAMATIRNPTKDTIAQLSNLSNVDPNWPGLKAALNQANAAFYRTVPAEPADQRRARELIALAKAVADSGDLARLPTALDYIQQAVQLDPDNEQATAVNSRLMSLRSKASLAALAPADEARYRSAVQEFQNGNYIQANAIVEALLQMPQYKYSQRLLDLSKKIKARL
jgi:hypothetical protein